MIHPTSKSFTKIVATIGPASSKREVLEKMFLEGLNICRLNFSHGTHEDHLKAINLIQELNEDLMTNVGILADLQGPKLRVGEMEGEGLPLKEGEVIHFVTRKCVGNKDGIYMSYERFPKDVKKGELVLVDDGKIRLEVQETNGKDRVSLKVLGEGVLKSRKGVNLPDTKISLPSLTEKDKKDVEFILQHKVGWIALSFVRRGQDIEDLKALTKKARHHVKVIAKIEKPEAIQAIDEILEKTDGVMIARGDLGVETPFDQVPILQKKLTSASIKKGKPVIIATQMMEGMITNLLPTRAETTDVSNAVADGTDAVMLSGETSVGKYPVEVIRNMKKVIQATESSGLIVKREEFKPIPGHRFFLQESVCYNACKVAEMVEAVGIVVFTFFGGTALRIARHRPNARIFVFTVHHEVMKQLSLVRGVESFQVDKKVTIDTATFRAVEMLKQRNLVKSGDRLILVAGISMDRTEPVDTVHISTVS